MEENRIKFTLLLATLNRPQQLRACVERLLKQTYTNYEIIIIDQSPDENVDESIAAMSPAIQYIRIRERGLSHARNVGLKYATGDYICLVDDDGVYAADDLKNAAEILARQNVDILSGMIIDPITHLAMPSRSIGRVGWRKGFKGCMSAALIIDRKLFAERGFDERFGVGAVYGSGEETDFVLYALKKGAHIFNTDTYIVYHNLDGIAVKPEDAEKKTYSYWQGYGALCKKTFQNYSRFWGMYYFLRSIVGNALKCYVLFPLLDASDVQQRRVRLRAVYNGFQNYSSEGRRK